MPKTREEELRPNASTLHRRLLDGTLKIREEELGQNSLMPTLKTTHLDLVLFHAVSDEYLNVSPGVFGT